VEAPGGCTRPLLELIEDSPWRLPFSPYEAGTGTRWPRHRLVDGTNVAPSLSPTPDRNRRPPCARPMSPSLTLPIRPRSNSPLTQVPNYLELCGAANSTPPPEPSTFTLVVWEPSWLQQQLIRTGPLDGPINGPAHTRSSSPPPASVHSGLRLAALPPLPMARAVHALGEQPGEHKAEDLARSVWTRRSVATARAG